MSFCKGYTQGGSNADIVIADAFIKNITDGIDWDTAYEAVVSDAEGEAEPVCDLALRHPLIAGRS
jgi:putative alpha-1,2-mannosidase